MASIHSFISVVVECFIQTTKNEAKRKQYFRRNLISAIVLAFVSVVVVVVVVCCCCCFCLFHAQFSHLLQTPTVR